MDLEDLVRGRTFRKVKDPRSCKLERSAIEDVRGALVKSRYSRSSTGWNIIKAGTIVDARIVVRDEEERQFTECAFHRVRVPAVARAGRRRGSDPPSETRVRDPGLDRDRRRTCRRELQDDTKGGQSKGREGNLRRRAGLEGPRHRRAEGFGGERDHGLSGSRMFVNASNLNTRTFRVLL